MVDSSLDKIKDARDKCGEVYEAEVKRDGHDNGLLDQINNATKILEDIVKKLKETAE